MNGRRTSRTKNLDSKEEDEERGKREINVGNGEHKITLEWALRSLTLRFMGYCVKRNELIETIYVWLEVRKVYAQL